MVKKADGLIKGYQAQVQDIQLILDLLSKRELTSILRSSGYQREEAIAAEKERVARLKFYEALLVRLEYTSKKDDFLDNAALLPMFYFIAADVATIINIGRVGQLNQIFTKERTGLDTADFIKRISAKNFLEKPKLDSDKINYPEDEPYIALLQEIEKIPNNNMVEFVQTYLVAHPDATSKKVFLFEMGSVLFPESNDFSVAKALGMSDADCKKCRVFISSLEKNKELLLTLNKIASLDSANFLPDEKKFVFLTTDNTEKRTALLVLQQALKAVLACDKLNEMLKAQVCLALLKTFANSLTESERVVMGKISSTYPALSAELADTKLNANRRVDKHPFSYFAYASANPGQYAALNVGSFSDDGQGGITRGTNATPPALSALLSCLVAIENTTAPLSLDVKKTIISAFSVNIEAE